MKLKSLMLAAAVAAVPAIALAQSAPSPRNQSGPGVNPTTQGPTDMGQGSESSVKGLPTPGANAQGEVTGSGAMKGTTGSSSTTGSSMGSGDTQEKPANNAKKNASPASPDEGIQKAK